MRDDEFVGIYKRLVPQLHKYFHTCLKNGGFLPPYEGIKRDLTHLTACAAFLNSRKESLSGWSIQALIWRKAENVWSDFIHPSKTKIQGIEIIENEKSKDPDPLYRMLVREKLELIKSKVDPATWNIIEMRVDGFTFPQIAQILEQQEGKIKMKVYRLRQWLEKESRRF